MESSGLGNFSGSLAPLAEGSGLINLLGDWIFKRVDSDILALDGAMPPELTISINLSPLQFSQANFWRPQNPACTAAIEQRDRTRVDRGCGDV